MGLILIPSEVTGRIEVFKAYLADVMDGFRGVLQTIQEFAADEELDTEAWARLKEKAADYHQAVGEGMAAAEDSILADAAALEESIGSEELDQDMLEAAVEKLEAERTACLEEMDKLQGLKENAAVGMFGSVCDYIDELLAYLQEEYDKIEKVLGMFREKLDFLVELEGRTSVLFEEASRILSVVEAVINDAGVEITGAGEMSGTDWKLELGGIIEETDGRIKEFLREALRSEFGVELEELEEMCGESAVERLIKAAKESGVDRTAEGSAEAFMKRAIEAVTGCQVKKADGKYWRMDAGGAGEEFAVSILEGQLIVDGYVAISEEIFQWYADAVATYCQMTREDVEANGGPSIEGGRRLYECSLPGNLNGIKVANDCSGYVWATLVQAGYFDSSIPQYTSDQYLPGNAAGLAMEEAGFVWYSLAELSGDDLKKGDILVKNGHIEIFYDYGENDQERALTWGSVYNKYPVLKWTERTIICQEYKGIWRLKP